MYRSTAGMLPYGSCEVQGANGLIGAGQGRSQSLSPPPMVVFMAARPAVFWAAMVDMVSVEPQLNPYLTSTSTSTSTSERS